MTENDPENKPILGDEPVPQNDSAESLHEKLRSLASEQAGAPQAAKKRFPQEIFTVQEQIAEKKNTSKKLMIAALVVIVVVAIGYPTKLAYEEKVQVGKLTMDYKSLQVAISDMTQRDYQLYKKIFPQVEELQPAKLDSALKGIEENIDTSAKLTQEADDLWAKENYEEALKLYDQASKVNPLNDKSAYLTREAELTKYDQEHFKQFYVVKKGDTIEGIAAKAGVSVERIQNANGPKYALLYQGRLIKGMQLALPVDIDLVR